jgi:hypothetical protein
VERAQSLVLGGRGDLVLDGPLRQKCDPVCSTQGTWVLHAMTVNKAFDPANIGGFGEVRSVVAPQRGANLIKQFGWV